MFTGNQEPQDIRISDFRVSKLRIIPRYFVSRGTGIIIVMIMPGM